MRRPRRLIAPVLAVVALAVAGCGGGASAADPAETEIAFATSRDGYYAVYGMRADGSGQGPLTAEGLETDGGITPVEAFFQVEPAWSPDGRRIVFVSKRSGRSHLYVMAADGTGTRQLTSGKFDDSSPSWSPDGGSIVFSRDQTLYAVSPIGGNPRRVTGPLGGEERDPAWSPDGKWIAYVRRRPGFTANEIWRAKADGSDARQLTRLDASSYTPSWSIDGKRIVFSSNANDDRYQIYEIGTDGKGLKRLTYQPGEYFDPSWSADGKTLLFERDGLLYTLVLGTPETAITEGPNDGSPAWRPGVTGAAQTPSTDDG